MEGMLIKFAKGMKLRVIANMTESEFKRTFIDGRTGPKETK